MAIDIGEIRKSYPGIERVVYLATSGKGPLTIHALNAMQTAAMSQLDPSQAPTSTIADVRHLLAALLHAADEEIVLTGNTSSGVNKLAGSLHWHPGDNIVVAEREHPANIVPWMYQAEQHGLELRMVQSPDFCSIHERLLSAIDDRTRVVAVSLVEFGTGYVNPVGDLASKVHQSDGLLFVDGIQAVGAIPVDVTELGIDVLACGGYKWLCGPVGTGFAYIRRDLIKKLSPPTVTYACLSEKWASDTHNAICYGEIYRSDALELADDAERFAEPKLSPLLYAGLEASLKYLAEVGFARIFERISYLNSLFRDLMMSRRIPLLPPTEGTIHGGIVSIPLPLSGSAAKIDAVLSLEEHLRNRGIAAHVRAGRVRVSIHFFNTEEELERAANILADVIALCTRTGGIGA